MEALKTAAGNGAKATRASADASAGRVDDASLAPRMRTALAALLEALEYAQDLDGSPWDFAIEISSMRRLKLSTSDLRWLVARGLVKHALEVTPPRNSVRSFRRPQRPIFGKKSCFVLTTEGADVARELRRAAEAREPAKEQPTSGSPASGRAALPRRAVPKWDRDRLELRVASVVVKRFKLPSAGQEAILAAFEELNWPALIDDPLPVRDLASRYGHLQEIVNGLNKNQRRSLLRFVADASGQRVGWEFHGESASPRDA